MNYEVILERKGHKLTYCLFKTKKLANAFIVENYDNIGSEYDLEFTLSDGYVKCTRYNLDKKEVHKYTTYETSCYDSVNDAQLYVRKLTK